MKHGSITEGLWLSLSLLVLPCRSVSAQEEAQAPQKSLEQQRLDTIHYGTETEIAALIGNLKKENADYLDNELIDLVKNTHNRSILTGVFTFFGERDKGGLEARARQAVEERDNEANETIAAAIDYLGKVKDPEAADLFKELINSDERRFISNAIRALGRIGGGNQGSSDEIAEYLVDYYTNQISGDEYRRDLIVAVGETGAKRGVSFLTDITDNSDERAVIRMAALESLAKIGDPDGLDAILASISSTDPNIRSTAVAALGPFTGPDVDNAILEAFRDSYYRTRISAAQAAKVRKLASAVPYLAYRAEQDEVAAVKDEAIRALGAIGAGEAQTTLEKLIDERKNSDQVKILAAEMLISLDSGRYAEKVIALLDDAKKRNQTALYNGLLRVISGAQTQKVESLAARFFESGGVLEKSYAIDMVVKNRFTGLIEQVRSLANGTSGLSGKAKTSLERLGTD